MIRQEKSENALYALQALLVRARLIAYEVKSKELIALLDCAEYLPSLIARKTDETDHFRDMLKGLSDRFSCREPLRKFDEQTGTHHQS